ncbi:hypothetical protein [Streptomyces sp. S584]|uniref:hypothetical protein n=1 Tax=Streptomyces sp. S584 TaxID=3096010 RepID=UPI002AFE846F|nr:hypothetical protein [Streptomyces sp. S584]
MNEPDRGYVPSTADEAMSLWLSTSPDTLLPNLQLSDLPVAGSGAFLREVLALALQTQREVAGPDVSLVADGRMVVVECKAYRQQTKRARARLWAAAIALQAASTARERRKAAREFCAAVAELVAHIIAFLVGVLLRLLSGLLGRTTAIDVAVRTPVPLERTPDVTPRGPNSAFPVNKHRGGRHRSALGSAVLAA